MIKSEMLMFTVMKFCC